MPISLGFLEWGAEWGCPYRGDTQITVTAPWISQVQRLSRGLTLIFLRAQPCSIFNILSVQLVTFRLKWVRNGQGYVIPSPFNSLINSPLNRP